MVLVRHVVKFIDHDENIDVDLVQFVAGDGIPMHDIVFSDIVQRNAISYCVQYFPHEHINIEMILSSIMDDIVLFHPSTSTHGA